MKGHGPVCRECGRKLGRRSFYCWRHPSAKEVQRLRDQNHYFYIVKMGRKR